MRRARRVAFALGATLAATVTAEARADEVARRVPTPLDGLAEDLGEAFTGTKVVLYGAALAETSVMAYGGGDHAARVFVRKNVVAPAWGDAAYVLGYALPAIVAPGVWIVGLRTDDRGLIGAGSAALQAVAATLATTALLKWATGRPFPLDGGDPHAPDVLDHPEHARRFAPFDFHGAWAWPSGHTSGVTSIVAALAAWGPEHVAIPLVGYPIALGVGAGMVVGDRHWTSDVVAGALFGYGIGTSIGASFRRRARADHAGASATSVFVVPLAGGAAVAGAW